MKQWIRTRLKFLAASPIVNGVGEKGEFDETEWPRYIRTTDIAGPRSLREGTYKSLPPSIAARAPVRWGDVLMTAAGATIGKSYLHLTEESACYAGYLVRFRSRADIDPRFIAYWTQSHPYWAQIDLGAVKSTIENFSAGRYRNLELAIPSVGEQRAIADFLDRETARIDALIEKKLATADRIRERYWVAFNRRVISTGSARVQMRRAFWSLTDGPFGSAFSSSEYVDQGTFVVRLGNIGFAEFRADPAAFIPREMFSSFSRYRVEEGNLLIAALGDERNHAGRACVAPDLGLAIVKGKCLCGRIDSRFADSQYLALLLSSPLGAEMFSVETRGSTRQMINLEIVKGLKIPMPRVDIQRSIADEFLRKREISNTVTASIGHQVQLLKEHRQALITAAVTGQLEIPEAP